MSLMYARPSFREFFLSIHFLLNRSACCAPTHSRALGDPWAVTLASSSVLIGTRVFFSRAIVENVTVSDCATRVRVLVVVQPLWGPLTNKSEGRRWFSVFWKAVLGRPTIWRLTHFSTTLDRSMRPGDQWEIFAEWIVDITRCRIITSCTICCAAFGNRRHPSRTRIGQVRHARKLRRTPAEGEIHGQLRPENSSIRLMWGRQRRLYDGRNHFVVFLCPILKSCRVRIHLRRWEAVTTISREKMKRWPKNVVKWLSISKKSVEPITPVWEGSRFLHYNRPLLVGHLPQPSFLFFVQRRTTTSDRYISFLVCRLCLFSEKNLFTISLFAKKKLRKLRPPHLVVVHNQEAIVFCYLTRHPAGSHSVVFF